MQDLLTEKIPPPASRDKIFTHKPIFYNRQKARLTKTLETQKPLQTMTFAKQRNLTNEPKQNLPNPLTKKASRF
jgi:hypothetical protein